MRRAVITTVLSSVAVAGTTFLAPAAQASSGHGSSSQQCYAYYDPFTNNFLVVTYTRGGQSKQYATDRPPASCTVIY